MQQSDSTRKSEEPASLSENIRTSLTTATITVLTVSAVHSIGADITIRITARSTTRTGTHTAIIPGDITTTMIHGTTVLGITADSMTHGITEATGAATIPGTTTIITTDGMTLGTAITTTTAGILHHTIISRDITSQETASLDPGTTDGTDHA